MKIKRMAIMVIIVGLTFIGIGGYQYLDTRAKEKMSLDLARSVIAKNKDNTNGQTSKATIPEVYPVDDYHPENGEPIGIISIPSINGEWPIVEGTSEEVLKAGVGHYNNTGFPSQGKQIFLAGHRDTVFSELGKLVEGDRIDIQMTYGTFAYEITELYIVGADNTTVIDDSIEEEILTLCTCYPLRYIGPAPDRYIINAKLVKEPNVPSNS